MPIPDTWPGSTETNPYHNNALGPPSSDETYIVVFKVGRQYFGLPLTCVERAVRMVALTPLPAAPLWVSGVFSLHGQIIRAISLRQRLGQPPQEIRLSDRLLLVNDNSTTFALIVDQVTEVMPASSGQLKPASEASPEPGLVEAVIEQPEYLVLVLNPSQINAGTER